MPIRLVNLEGLNSHILTSYQLWFSKKRFLKNAKIPCKIGTSQDLAIFAKSRIWFSTECHNFQFAAIFGLSDWLNWLMSAIFFILVSTLLYVPKGEWICHAYTHVVFNTNPFMRHCHNLSRKYTGWSFFRKILIICIYTYLLTYMHAYD